MLCSYCEAFGFCDEHRGFPKNFQILAKYGHTEDDALRQFL